jgi:hypothetical protein
MQPGVRDLKYRQQLRLKKGGLGALGSCYLRAYAPPPATLLTASASASGMKVLR